jgi:hypothetical protein
MQGCASHKDAGGTDAPPSAFPNYDNLEQES